MRNVSVVTHYGTYINEKVGIFLQLDEYHTRNIVCSQKWTAGFVSNTYISRPEMTHYSRKVTRLPAHPNRRVVCTKDDVLTPNAAS